MAAQETRGARGDATHVEPPDRAVAALAGAQHGVVTRDQLLAAGLSRHGVASRVAAGHLHRVHRGFSLTSEFVQRDGIAVTTPARTLLDLAATATRADLERALHEARLLHLVSQVKLQRRSHARPGASALRDVEETRRLMGGST
jgi:hypothetical protein